MAEKTNNRPALYILTIGVALLAWALIFFSLSSGRNQVTGRVLDAYTNKGIEGAIVSVGSEDTETAENGVFRLAGTKEEIRVRVKKEKYEPTTTFLRTDLENDEFARVKLRPNTLSGIVRDSMSGRPVKGATIQGEKHETTTDSNGRYFLKKVPEKIALEMTGPNSTYEVARFEVERRTRFDLKISPTAEEAVSRIGDLTVEADYEDLYQLVHPDLKKLVSEAQFLKFNRDLDEKRSQSRQSLTGLEVTDTRTLPSWYNSTTKKRYGQVVEAKTVLLYLSRNRLQRSQATIHLVKVDGVWRYFITATDVKKARRV